MAKSSPSPAAIVTGIAWVMIVVSAWATLRLGFMLLTSFQVSDGPAKETFLLPEALQSAFIVTHLLLGIFSLYAGISMLRYKPWTRPYFATVLVSIGLEACVGAVFFVLQDSGSGSLQEVQGLRLASGGTLLLLGSIALLLAWKLWRDAGIASVLKGK